MKPVITYYSDSVDDVSRIDFRTPGMLPRTA